MTETIVEAILGVDKFENILEKALNSQIFFSPTSIQEKRNRHSKYAYLVQWKDFPTSERTWEPENHFGKRHYKLREFKHARGLPQQHEKVEMFYPPAVWEQLVEASKTVEGTEFLMTEKEKIPQHLHVEEMESNIQEHVDKSASIGALMLFGNKVEDSLNAVSQDLLKHKRTKDIRILYRGKEQTMPALFKNRWRDRNEDRTLLNDTIIEFYMCQWMFFETFDNEARNRFYVFHTFFYTKLSLRFNDIFKDGPLRHSELAAYYEKIFHKVNGKELLQKEVLVVPIHLEKPKHWFLALIHNPSGAIHRRCVSNADNRKNNRKRSSSEQVSEYASFEETSDCRIIIMDSLCRSTKYSELLAEAHDLAFNNLTLWLQMVAASSGEEFMTNRVKNVVCQSLPMQSNSVDCGLYMMAFAEYYTWFNNEWMTLPADLLVNLKMEIDLESLLNSEEPRARLEALIQRLKAQGPTEQTV